jgi:hypothetical protein
VVGGQRGEKRGWGFYVCGSCRDKWEFIRDRAAPWLAQDGGRFERLLLVWLMRGRPHATNPCLRSAVLREEIISALSPYSAGGVL